MRLVDRRQGRAPVYRGQPAGWSGDTIDGALLVLLVSGLIRANNEQGKSLDFKGLERKAIGKALFKVESTTVTVKQRIEIRKLFQKLDVNAKPTEENLFVPAFLSKLDELRKSAGGEAPKPETPPCEGLTEATALTGNEQLLALYNRREDLTTQIESWKQTSADITSRWESWKILKELSQKADDLPDAGIVTSSVATIEHRRQLLDEPNPVTPLTSNLCQIFRTELNRLMCEYDAQHGKGLQSLEADSNWKNLEPEQKDEILRVESLLPKCRPVVDVQGPSEIVSSLRQWSLKDLANCVAALPTRFSNALTKAAELMEPEATFVALPRQTLKTESDVHTWLRETQSQLMTAIAKGPVVIR